MTRARTVRAQTWILRVILPSLVPACSSPTLDQAVQGTTPAGLWEGGDILIRGAANLLTPQEQDVVVHLNLARANPRAYAQTFLAPRRALFRGNIYFDPLDPRRRGLRTQEGVGAVDDAVREMSRMPELPPLTVAAALTQAAREHAEDQSVTGELGHAGGDDSTPATRVSRQATWGRIVGEVIAYGPVSGTEIVSWLLIDDGIASRGHRSNILNPGFQVVGVAIRTHPEFGHVVVIDFADSLLTSAQ